MRPIAFLFCFLFFSCGSSHKLTNDWATRASTFSNAPDSIQTSVYWYWISDNISKEGLVKDLHAMKKVGINRAFIGNIGLDDIPKEKWGKVNIFSDAWWDAVHTALKTATELGIDIGMFNGPGWSQSGGPWVKETQAMRYLYAADTLVRGGTRFTGKVGHYPANLQRTNVLAFQVPKDYHLSLANSKPSISGNLEGDLTTLLDKQHRQGIHLLKDKPSELLFTMDRPFSARSLIVHTAHQAAAFQVRLEVERDGQFVEIKTFHVDRTNPAVNVGFDPFAPATVSFAAAEGRKFRLLIDQVQGEAGITEVELTTTPKVEHTEEKVFAKMHPTPLPFWHHYMWERQAESDDPAHAVDPASVKNLTDMVSNEGILDWEVPAGEWIIMQTGMLPTGAFNAPAVGGGQGLEIDKMSEEHVQAHFDAFVGEIFRRVPEQDRKSFKVVVQDSYETGGQNWTDDFEQKFQKAFGYDPKPYLQAYYGFVVGSQDESDRFLWDMRRFVADQVAYEFVGGFRKISHKHGLTTWLENYGHWGFPGEFLQYGGQSDEVGGEFWSEGELGDIENRAASSAAHIYGKNKVSAESFTAAGNIFGRYPAMFKERGDRFFAEGINNSLLHVYIHQPYADKLPGVNAWFGNDFNRLNTWFYEMDGFLAYLKRSNYMLQQGKYVADVAYFIGEDAPKMTGVQQPSLPKGYDFDYMNAEVILSRMTLKDGRFTLPDGVSYKILVLPPLETMRPALLQKIAALVEAGGVVLGPRPKRSPSLQDFRKADQVLNVLADKMWGNIDGKSVKSHAYGKGLLLEGMSLEEAFALLKLRPDVQLQDDAAVHYLHRTLSDGDIYFLTNQSGQPITFSPSFRISGKRPALWDAVSGEIRALPDYSDNGETTTVPMELSAQGSAFVVFRDQETAAPAATLAKANFPAAALTIPIAGSWDLTFTSPDSVSFKKTFNDLSDWSTSSDAEVKYFSGSAVYRIALPDLSAQLNKRIVLQLGQVGVVASVSVNDKLAGNVWTNPYEIDISDYCREGKNELSIKVTNTWVNSLIGDQQLAPSAQKRWTIVNPYNANSKLHSGGLLGPVKLAVYERE